MGVISSIIKAAWIMEEEWADHCAFPALSRPPWRWVKGITPLSVLCHHLPQLQQQEQRGLELCKEKGFWVYWCDHPL